MTELQITTNIRIPRAEFSFTFTRSSGPGGQNVNKVNSRATLRWSVRNSKSLPADVRDRFLARYGSRVTTDGDILISSQRFRDQDRNLDDCQDKLQAMIAEVVHPPKKRKPTKPTRGSRERRLSNKARESAKKQHRRDWRGD